MLHQCLCLNSCYFNIEGIDTDISDVLINMFIQLYMYTWEREQGRDLEGAGREGWGWERGRRNKSVAQHSLILCIFSLMLMSLTENLKQSWLPAHSKTAKREKKKKTEYTHG